MVQLLLPFTVMKYLYLSKLSAPGIAAALQELVGDGITEVLPSLQIFSWKALSHRDLSRKTLGSSLPRDSSRIRSWTRRMIRGAVR